MNLLKEIDKAEKLKQDLELIRSFIEAVDTFFEVDIDITDLDGIVDSEARFIAIEQMLKQLKERKIYNGVRVAF